MLPSRQQLGTVVKSVTMGSSPERAVHVSGTATRRGRFFSRALQHARVVEIVV